MNNPNVSTALEQYNAQLVELEPETALTLRTTFDAMFAQTDEWAARARDIKVTSVDQVREMKFARECRLALREIRVNAEKARKRLKEDSVRRGKAIDGFANIIKAAIEPIEEHLLEQETFAQRADDLRKDSLRQARCAALVAYGVDPSSYADLGSTSEETWASILETAKLAHEQKQESARHAERVRLEAERISAEKAELARVESARLEAERVERERIAAEENARLRQEATEREAQIAHVKAEAEKASKLAAAEAEDRRAERQAEIAKEREHRQRVEAAAQLEREKLEAQAEQARKAHRLVELELEAKRHAERAAAKKMADAAAAAMAAPDREKLLAVAGALRKLAPAGLTTDWGRKAAKKLGIRLEQLATEIEQTGGAL